MKKLMVLMFVSCLSLAGCGGGGGDETTAGIPGNNPSVISDPAAGPTGNITITFEPQQTQRALVDAGWIRNHARLVVRQFATVSVQPPILEEGCIVEVPGDCIIGYGDPIPQYMEVLKKVSDAPLSAAGAGSVSIAVPTGDGYTLEVLTYFSDKTGQPGVAATPTPTGNNYILEYGKNNDGALDANGNPVTFAIVGGVPNVINVNLGSDLAQLAVPTEPVLSTTTYPVSVAAKSDALRDTWKVRQALAEADLASKWFTATTGDLGVSGTVTAPITLTAPLETDSNRTGATWAPSWKLWHHGQFFISDHLLGFPGDASWEKWTFGTSNAGLLNPLGGIIIVFN